MGALDLGAVELLSVEPAGDPPAGDPLACELCREVVVGETWSLHVRNRTTNEPRTAPLCAPCADAYGWLVDVLATPRTGRPEGHWAPRRGGAS